MFMPPWSAYARHFLSIMVSEYTACQQWWQKNSDPILEPIQLLLFQFGKYKLNITFTQLNKANSYSLCTHTVDTRHHLELCFLWPKFNPHLAWFWSPPTPEKHIWFYGCWMMYCFHQVVVNFSAWCWTNKCFMRFYTKKLPAASSNNV